MFITNDLVMLNLPKSGSTFARNVLRQIHENRDTKRWPLTHRFRSGSAREINMVIHDKKRVRNKKGQHGTLRQIPEQHRNKKIVSIIRSPFTRYISGYLYRYWAKFPHVEQETLLKKYPTYPELSFEDYMDMIQRFGTVNRLNGIETQMGLGFQTIQFVQMFFKNPEEVLGKITPDYIESEAYRDDMPDIYFLHQENLRVELNLFLLEMGYTKEEAELAETMGKARVSARNTEQQDDNTFYNDDLIGQVLKRDALLFKLFPQYTP